MSWFSGLVQNEVPFSDIEKEKSRFRTWDYEPFGYSGTGYEDYEEELTQYTSKDFNNADDAGKEGIINDIFSIYREVDIFPIKYFSQAGAYNEIVKCMNFDAKFNGDTVSTGVGIGTELCNWAFPNLYDAQSTQDKSATKNNVETMIKKFNNDKYLKRAIQFCYSYDGGKPVPGQVLAGLRMMGSAPTNFRPANASAIIKRFLPEGGTYYDFACGYGGRLLGTLMSGEGYKYVGVDPNYETMYNLHRLGSMIEDVTGLTDSFELHCVGSEEFRGPENSVDFAFSSPPYFDLEIYSDDPGQSVKKYPEIDGWLEGYVRGTVKNIRHMLKPGGYYCVNIADFTVNGKNVNFVDAWAKISEEEGLPKVDTLYLGVTARTGSKQIQSSELKKETISVFQNRK